MNTTVAIPPQARGIVYTIWGFLGLAVGATQVGYAAAQAGQPVWLTVTLAVYAFMSAGIGYTAATHTPAAGSAKTSDLVAVPDAPAEYLPERALDEG